MKAKYIGRFYNRSLKHLKLKNKSPADLTKACIEKLEKSVIHFPFYLISLSSYLKIAIVHGRMLLLLIDAKSNRFTQQTALIKVNFFCNKINVKVYIKCASKSISVSPTLHLFTYSNK